MIKARGRDWGRERERDCDRGVQSARILRANFAQFVRCGLALFERITAVFTLHADPVAGPPGRRRIPTWVRPPAPATLEIGPVVDLEESPAVHGVADQEACLGEFGDGPGDFALGDLGAHREAVRPDALGAAR